MPSVKDIPIKKRYGQHFLRDQKVVDHMVEKVQINSNTSVFEIGCGDGFLTKTILATPIKQLWIFEIDSDWATYVKNTLPDPRMTMHEVNVLDQDFSIFVKDQPWTLLANLPYQITFPILHMLERNKKLLREGVIMVQEEVAQKIVKKGGRDYGYPSLFFQYHFTWELMDKISPSAFFPPPKVYSRLMYFKPRVHEQPIMKEEEFWRFIKLCFRQPRRTLKNNLAQTQIDLAQIPEQTLLLRAQQMSFDDFISLWQMLQGC